MAELVIDGLKHFYNSTLEGDPRVADWPLMQSPWPTVGICLSYVYLVKYLGPALMKDREPFNIRYLMAIYNFSMVLVSVIIFFKLGDYGWFGKYNYKCQPVDYSNSVEAIGMAHLSWWYYISKFAEFCDTIFFVLRKKFTHVSTLHVIHHGIMPISVWWGVKFTPGGHSTFFAFVNSFVHIIMYIYYGLSAIGPHMNKFLWWKKYMTTIQMVQFILIFVHSFQLLFRECNYPRGFMWWIGVHAILFWFLFWDFYKNAYRKPGHSWWLSSSAEPSERRSSAGGLTTMCSLDYDQLFANGHKRNGTVVSNGSANASKSVYTNGIHKAHNNGIKCKDL